MSTKTDIPLAIEVIPGPDGKVRAVFRVAGSDHGLEVEGTVDQITQVTIAAIKDLFGPPGQTPGPGIPPQRAEDPGPPQRRLIVAPRPLF
jgi:hypothetical protein